MRISQDDIRRWLEAAKAEGATHVVVRSDDFSHEYYPHACHSASHAREVASKTDNMQSTVEVYKLSMNWDEQLDTPRCFNY